MGFYFIRKKRIRKKGGSLIEARKKNCVQAVTLNPQQARLWVNKLGSQGIKTGQVCVFIFVCDKERTRRCLRSRGVRVKSKRRVEASSVRGQIGRARTILLCCAGVRLQRNLALVVDARTSDGMCRDAGNWIGAAPRTPDPRLQFRRQCSGSCSGRAVVW